MLLFLLPLCAVIGIVNWYWIIPTLKEGGESGLAVSILQLVSLLNPFFLFQPHWPLNEFGKVSPPPFYFVGIPLMMFGSLLLKREKEILPFIFYFLLFAFLAKGATPPLGDFYNFIISGIPLGSAFRDSTKFFAPLILAGGVLIGFTTQLLTRTLKKASTVVLIAVYMYLLFLIHPALTGSLNGVLAARNFPSNLENLNQNLIGEEDFFRTVWFPQRHPLAFQTEQKPAVDADRLVEKRPFASINVGTYDVFNFLHNKQFIDWFDLLGIKYLIFSSDPRKAYLNEEEKREWDSLLQLMATSSGLIRKDWGVDFPVYALASVKPLIFSVDKVLLVVGGDDVYEQLKSNVQNFSVGNQGFLFVEDGKFDLDKLSDVEDSNLLVVFNNKTEIDLVMSFLRDYMIDLRKSNTKSEWALRSSSQYLQYKYELLINKVNIKEFDYGKGIAFSTQEGERFNLDIKPSKEDEYYLAIRSLSADVSDNLAYEFTEKGEITNKNSDVFEWSILGPFNLNKSNKKLTIVNPRGVHAVNTVALVPKREFETAQKKAQKFLSKFNSFDVKNLSESKNQELLASNAWQYVDYVKISQEEYRIYNLKKKRWLVFSNNFHLGWKSLPFYSSLNGFYINEDNFTIRFRI